MWIQTGYSSDAGHIEIVRQRSKKTKMPLRINVDEVVKLMRGRKFKAIPKKKYAYLTLTN